MLRDRAGSDGAVRLPIDALEDGPERRAEGTAAGDTRRDEHGSETAGSVGTARGVGAAGNEIAAPGDTTGADDPPATRSPRRRARRAPAARGAGTGRRNRPTVDPFAERLRALEREIDEALARAGGSVDGGLLMRARGAAEELIAFYADLARAFARGGAYDVFIRVRMIGTADEVDDFGYDGGFRQQIAPLVRFLYDRWWRVELLGVDNVPASGRVLLVANHGGALFPYDALMLAHGIAEHRPGGGRELRPLIEDFVYHFPFVGPALARAGMVRASQENAERLLAREAAVAVFPEGAKGLGKYYRERYRLQRFGRGGFVTLAMRSTAPIVPVAIIGSEEVHPVIAKWQWLARLLDLPYFPVTPTFPWLGLAGLIPLPTKWRVIFGAPIDLAAEYGPSAHEDDLLVNRLKEQVRDRIQRMIIDGLRGRDSVFTG